RVEEGELELRGRAVLLAGDDAAKRVFRLHRDDIARIDREDGFCIGPVDVVKIALCRDGEFVALAGLTPGDASLCHDRSFQPGLNSHRDILVNWCNANRTPASFFLASVPLVQLPVSI